MVCTDVTERVLWVLLEPGNGGICAYRCEEYRLFMHEGACIHHGAGQSNVHKPHGGVYTPHLWYGQSKAVHTSSGTSS